MVADEQRDVRLWRGRLIARKIESRRERPEKELAPAVHVRNMMNQQEVRTADLDLVSLIPKSFQVRVTTYQFL